MKFNKIVALALALVMVFALCACGGSTDTKTDDTGSASKVDTNTVSVGAVVIARDDVPTDEIYAFVSTIFDNLDAITAQHAKGAELSIEAAASVKGVPYHPGAAKYFEEKGVKVDAVKEGAGNGTASALNFGTGGPIPRRLPRPRTARSSASSPAASPARTTPSAACSPPSSPASPTARSRPSPPAALRPTSRI